MRIGIDLVIKMPKFDKKESKHLDLCGKVCNWVVSIVGLSALGTFVSDEYYEEGLESILALGAIICSVVYFLLVIYRHMHIAKMEKEGNCNVADFSYKMMKVQVFLSIVTLAFFVLSYYNQYIISFE